MAVALAAQQTGWRGLPPALIAGFALLVAMVVASLIFAIRLSNNTTETARLVEYRSALNAVSIAARDEETGQRGFLLTGKDNYLEPYRRGAIAIDAALADIRRTGGESGNRTADELQRILGAKAAELRETIRLALIGRRDEAIAIVQSDAGKRYMDTARTLFDGEWARTRERAMAIVRDSETIVRWLTIGLIGGLLAVMLLSQLWLRQARAQFAEVDRARAEAEDTLAALKTENAAREDAEGQVRQLQKMESLGQLTGGIAHDFNNMLAVVMGGLELAQRRLRTDPDKVEQYLENAKEGAMRAAALTSRLLAFSRQQPLAPKPLDANKLVGGMADMLDRTLGDTIAVETVLGAGVWHCYADPGELENALLNLAVNARDAMPDGGKLNIETANAHIDDNYARTRGDVDAGQYVVISVTDTGSGMTHDVVERAFDPFFTTKDVGKGTGLGLSQVFGFSKQSGGHVAIYSEVGEGTTVKVYLPRFIGAREAVVSALDSEGTPEGTATEIILVVEDEHRVRHFAVDVLRELGYTAISAASPAEALKAIEEQPEISLLFTDIVMPDMNGRRLADLARVARPDLKVLYTTGYTRNAVVHNGMVDVGVAFLPKPYTIGDLARKIRQVLDGGGVNRWV